LRALRSLVNYVHFSLYNVIYKIVSKVVKNSLKMILPEIISEEQWVLSLDD
jgi:hypothetical protein